MYLPICASPQERGRQICTKTWIVIDGFLRGANRIALDTD
jgi:hypothetical protein